MSGQLGGVLAFDRPLGNPTRSKELTAALRAARDNTSDVNAVVWRLNNHSVRVRYSYSVWQGLYGPSRMCVEFAGILFRNAGAVFISERPLSGEEFAQVRDFVCRVVVEYKKKF